MASPMPKGGKGVAKKAVPVAPMPKKVMPSPTPKKEPVGTSLNTPTVSRGKVIPPKQAPVGTSLNTPKAGTGGIGVAGTRETDAQKQARLMQAVKQAAQRGNIGAPRAVARKPVAMSAPSKKTLAGR